MRLSRKQAILDCKTIWAEVANGSAENKEEALELHPEILAKHPKEFSQEVMKLKEDNK